MNFVEVLSQRIQNNDIKDKDLDFANSLVSFVVEKQRHWSDKQLYWVKHFCSEEYLFWKKEAKPKEQKEEKVVFSHKLLSFFSKAAEKDGKSNWLTVTLTGSLKLAYSKNANKVFPIDTHGEKYKSLSEIPASDLRAIASFEQDPTEFARSYGKRTNHCCFCSRILHNEVSVYHGYGPICADKYGLPWEGSTASQFEEM